MEVRSPRFNYESLLFGIAFLLALIIRFVHLGAVPLSDAEANLALQSLGIVRGTDPVLGSQPGYVLPTALWFFLFGDSNGSARFWPALMGSLLVFVPYLFRRPFGRVPAVLLAFALAFDPGLVALSRQVGSATWAMATLLFAFGFLWNKQIIPAGIAFGLALLGGPALWAGAVAAGLSWLIYRLLLLSPRSEDLEEEAEVEPQRGLWSPLLIPWAAGAFLLVGTLILNVPMGISAAVSSIPGYLQSWVQPSGLGVAQLLFAALGYAPLAILCGLIRAISGAKRKDPVDRFLIVAWGVSLLLALILPGRQYSYFAWSMIPLWALAARGITELIRIPKEDRTWTLSLAMAILVLLVFVWFSLLSLDNVQTPEDARLRWISAIGSVFLILLAILLVGWGWSFQVAARGIGIALSVFLLIFTLGGSIGVTGLAANPSAQLWRVDNPIGEANLLTQTIGDLSEWNAGSRDSIDIQVAGVPSDALKWALRDFQNARFDDVLDIQASPRIVITTEELSPSLAASYTGQGFTWNQYPFWHNLPLDQWLEWLSLRRVPIEGQKIILWARSDLFPAAGQPAGQ